MAAPRVMSQGCGNPDACIHIPAHPASFRCALLTVSLGTCIITYHQHMLRPDSPAALRPDPRHSLHFVCTCGARKPSNTWLCVRPLIGVRRDHRKSRFKYHRGRGRAKERERECGQLHSIGWRAHSQRGVFVFFFRKLRLAAVQAICEHHHFISSQIKIYLCLRHRSGKSTGICGTYLNPSKTLVVLFYLFDRSTSQHRNICLLFVFVAHRPKNLFCRMPCVFSTHLQGTFKIYSSTPPLCTPAFLFSVGEMADCSELNNHSPRLVTAHISDGRVNVY